MIPLESLDSCGFQHVRGALEVHTPWVKSKISRFSSPSTPLSRSISKVPGVISSGGLILVRELDERLGRRSSSGNT